MTPILRASITLALMLILALMLACGASQQTGQQMGVMHRGSLPDWNLDEIVGRSDAVIVAKVVREIGTKRAPGSSEGWNYLYKEYELAVEKSLFPAALPQRIAILAEVGIDSTDPKVRVIRPAEHEDDPRFEVGERVMLFLESLQGEAFESGPGRPVPARFTKDTYYRVITSTRYGKLSPVDGKWKDSRVPVEVTNAEVEQAVAKRAK